MFEIKLNDWYLIFLLIGSILWWVYWLLIVLFTFCFLLTVLSKRSDDTISSRIWLFSRYLVTNLIFNRLCDKIIIGICLKCLWNNVWMCWNISTVTFFSYVQFIINIISFSLFADWALIWKINFIIFWSLLLGVWVERLINLLFFRSIDIDNFYWANRTILRKLLFILNRGIYYFLKGRALSERGTIKWVAISFICGWNGLDSFQWWIYFIFIHIFIDL